MTSTCYAEGIVSSRISDHGRALRYGIPVETFYRKTLIQTQITASYAEFLDARDTGPLYK